MNQEPVRLQKLLANAGLGSRRTIEEYITQGRITLNGSIAQLGDKATSNDKILFDGEAVVLDQEIKWFLLNKPLGVISSVTDDRGRKTVVDLIDTNLRVFPVGRLDINTTGLLIITNDGELTHKLTHPSFGIEKKYVVQVNGEINEDALNELRTGVELEDGLTAPAKARIIAMNENKTVIELSIHEGKNRQVRRMMEKIGHRVVSLHRSQIGPISDKILKPGQYRELTLKEIHSLYQSTNNGESS